jgi:hypothetical protein
VNKLRKLTRAGYEQKKNNDARLFLQRFVGWITRGRVVVVHFGWWPISDNKFGLSMTWEVRDK